MHVQLSRNQDGRVGAEVEVDQSAHLVYVERSDEPMIALKFKTDRVSSAWQYQSLIWSCRGGNLLQQGCRGLRHPCRQVRQRAIRLFNDIGCLAAKAVATDDCDALTVARMKAVVDRDFGRVLMGSMLLA